MLGALFVTGHSGRDSIPLIVACLVVFMFFNAGGLQLMGWLTGSEIYPLAVRSAGTSAQSMTLWTTNMLITLTVLTMIEGIGVGPTMWVYAAFNVAAWIFVFLRMPELTGPQPGGASRAGCARASSARRTSRGEAPTGQRRSSARSRARDATWRGPGPS